MLHPVRAVARGARAPPLLADMPFGTYHASPADAVRNAVRLVREGGADAVKLEGGAEIADTVRALTRVGIPVVAHLGLLPQRHVMLSGFRVQARDAEGALDLLRSARALEDAGAFAVVLEMVPGDAAAQITDALSIPTIGIGAGADCDAQVLVWQDMAGLRGGRMPRFVKQYADLRTSLLDAARAYASDVESGTFPAAEHTF